MCFNCKYQTHTNILLFTQITRLKNTKRNFTNLQNCGTAIVGGRGVVLRTVQLILKQLDQVLKAEQIAVVGSNVSCFVL